MNLHISMATEADVEQLAAMNEQLIRDEGHRNAMSIDELQDRMRNWLRGEYEAAVIAVDDATAGYALFKREPEWTYLRQFFVVPELRRQGIGRSALQWLMQHAWRDAPRIRLDVLIGNSSGIAFWRSLGFQDYCLTMELQTRKS